jgi:hypothetical protein
MSKWNFSHKPDSDWGEDDSSGKAVQPDHYPNVARPGGGYPEGHGEVSDAVCKTCNQNHLIDGSCPLCDWGPQSRGNPGGNYPHDPYGTDMVHFRSKVEKTADSEFSPKPEAQWKNWNLLKADPEDLQEMLSEHPEGSQSYWDMSVGRGEIPVPHAETNPVNYQRPRPEDHQPKEEDPEGFNAPIPEWRRKLMTLYPEIARMTEAEISDYFGRKPVKTLLKSRKSKEIKLENWDDPIVRSDYGPNDWHYRYDPMTKKYFIEWPAKNTSSAALSKEDLERWLGTLRAQDAEREGQLSLDDNWNF